MKNFDEFIYLDTFGLTLKHLRLSRNLTQEQLAKKLDVTPSAITMYESGSRNPSIRMLTKISDFFNISIDELVGAPQKNNINEAVLGISTEEFNQLSSAQKESIRNFISFIKSQK